MLNPNEAKTVLEAALLAAQEPLTLAELRRLFEEDIGADTVRRLLDELRESWQGRGVELVNLSSGWRFKTLPSTSSTCNALPTTSRRAIRAP